MSSLKRATIYFDPDLHTALRVKAAATDQSVSDIVNAAVRLRLQEDAADLSAFESRETESSLAFEDVLKDLRRRGRL